jgi:hypothetical protein
VKSKQKSGKSKYRICVIQTIKNRFFVWISPIFYLDFTNILFEFPGFSKESGKFKLKNSEIETIMRGNPNKKNSFFYSLDTADFMFWFPGF